MLSIEAKPKFTFAQSTAENGCVFLMCVCVGLNVECMFISIKIISGILEAPVFLEAGILSLK